MVGRSLYSGGYPIPNVCTYGWGVWQNKNKWKDPKHNTHVYVTGLPLDVTADEVPPRPSSPPPL